MINEDETFGNKFIEAIKNASASNKNFNLDNTHEPYITTVRLIKPDFCISIYKTAINPKNDNNHDCVTVAINGSAIVFDSESIKDPNIVNQIDEVNISHKEAIEMKNLFKNLFREAIKEYEREKKYKGISNKQYDEIKYGHISYNNKN